MRKEELLKELENRGFDFDTRALIVNDVFDIINKQLAELKADLKAKDLLVDCYMSVVGTLDNAKNLQQQLKEKDDEIEKYYKFLCHIADLCKTDVETLLFTNGEIIRKANTKQVCEKIKSNIGNFDTGVHFNRIGFIKWLEEFLDQIKGESDGKTD